MKTKTLLIGCCVAALLIFSGCRGTEDKKVPSQKGTKKETVSADISRNSPPGNSAPGNTPAQDKSVKPQAVTGTSGTQNVGTETGQPAETMAETAQEGTVPGPEADGTGNAESAQQCPYCGEWFSTLPDGDLWNPYDRHMLEERDSQQGGEQAYEYPEDTGTAEAEMVQCPDCGNWYEAGNIFRNHICEGR